MTTTATNPVWAAHKPRKIGRAFADGRKLYRVKYTEFTMYIPRSYCVIDFYSHSPGPALASIGKSANIDSNATPADFHGKWYDVATGSWADSIGG